MHFYYVFNFRLGYAFLLRIQFLASQGHLGSVDLKYFYCVSCHLRKQTHFSFNKNDYFLSAPFDLVYYDIWGSVPILTEGRFCYFVIFVDDYSCYIWIYCDNIV
jgi:hypothetical protein